MLIRLCAWRPPQCMGPSWMAAGMQHARSKLFGQGQALMTGHRFGEALYHFPVSCGEFEGSVVTFRDAVVLESMSDGVRVEVVPGMQGHVPTAELDITHYPDLAGFRPGFMISGEGD